MQEIRPCLEIIIPGAARSNWGLSEVVRVLRYIKQRRFVRQPRLGICLCPLEGRRRIKRGERGLAGARGPRRATERRCWRRHGSCNNRKVSCSGRRQASEHHLATALTYVTGSHNNFTQPRGTRQDVERAFPGSSSPPRLSWKKAFEASLVLRPRLEKKSIVAWTRGRCDPFVAPRGFRSLRMMDWPRVPGRTAFGRSYFNCNSDSEASGPYYLELFNIV